MTSSLIQFELPYLALTIALVGAVIDARSHRIPNRLTGPAMLLGLLLHAQRSGWQGLGSSLSALLACGAVFLLFHLAGGMGAGDVKLIAAEGALLGWSGVLPLLVFTALAGGLLALCMAARHGRLRQTACNVAALVVHHREHGLQPHPELHVGNGNTLRLPYGVAIAAGVALACCPQLLAVAR